MQFTVTIPDDLVARLDAAALCAAVGLDDLVALLLQRALDQELGAAPLSMADYQTAALRTAAKYHVADWGMAIAALGLVGESGEVAEIVKKHLGHNHVLDRGAVCKELGDVLWYVAALASACGLRLSDVAQANVDKLRRRYPQGFSADASRNRTE